MRAGARHAGITRDQRASASGAQALPGRAWASRRVLGGGRAPGGGAAPLPTPARCRARALVREAG
eukprot:14400713-Alexandrium_andersonii.AAC.1